jgi:hypothetical protein
MPRPKRSAMTGTAELNAMIERVAPDILKLLAVVKALAERHDRQDVIHALTRLAVTGQVEETGGKYALAPARA